MVSRILVLLLSFISFSSFAAPATQLRDNANLRLGCQQAPPTTSGDFCAGFKSSAYCHCLDKGMDPSVCDDMNQVYDAMMAYFRDSPEGPLAGACNYGQDQEDGVPKQVCIDDWNCYRNGGANSQAGLCSSTGQTCQ
jgi:hypothetical protein